MPTQEKNREGRVWKLEAVSIFVAVLGTGLAIYSLDSKLNVVMWPSIFAAAVALFIELFKKRSASK